MKPTSQVLLQFDPALNQLGNGKRLAGGLSVVTRIGDTLWLANDETASLERLTLFKTDQNTQFIGLNHCQFRLSDFLKLPVTPDISVQAGQEVDLEGLAHADGYLWMIGSHSLKRGKPKPDRGDDANQDKLATVSSEGNRYLLARIPVVENNGLYSLVKKVETQGKTLKAACLHADKDGNELTQALKKDRHLAAFMAIPGKDNGFDIEGLAVVGKRLFIGLRGPVLRGWALILEIEPDEQGKHLRNIGPKHALYRKHFLQLDGLGIRDLCLSGSDLLILAGPSMNLDGPVAVFRWPDAATVDQECLVPAAELERILEIPYGQGEDHPEGMTLFSADHKDKLSILIVNDSAAANRQPSPEGLLADVFRLP
ncbi:DUF3616 domain-containing protein [Methylomonas sp. LL1]|uniref:DUF3616 domain-containing protein n=1 Tax=Methylomonas sp. LL1 TaxID=2785785 RepID=UPI0018C407EB|nr:DUF3616 domain-containing protein [Methylomonas sp. LL1]QPK64224.1 DUF3616 domain-containing protein [Methylomonas sp. LL1]